MSEEQHGQWDGDERWTAFVEGCPNCHYRRMYEHLHQAKMKLTEVDPNSIEAEAMFTFVSEKAQELMDFGYSLAVENDKAKRRQKEALYN